MISSSAFISHFIPHFSAPFVLRYVLIGVGKQGWATWVDNSHGTGNNPFFWLVVWWLGVFLVLCGFLWGICLVLAIFCFVLGFFCSFALGFFLGLILFRILFWFWFCLFWGWFWFCLIWIFFWFWFSFVWFGFYCEVLGFGLLHSLITVHMFFSSYLLPKPSPKALIMSNALSACEQCCS